MSVECPVTFAAFEASVKKHGLQQAFLWLQSELSDHFWQWTEYWQRKAQEEHDSVAELKSEIRRINELLCRSLRPIA